MEMIARIDKLIASFDEADISTWEISFCDEENSYSVRRTLRFDGKPRFRISFTYTMFGIWLVNYLVSTGDTCMRR
jgi:hypothetical protein